MADGRTPYGVHLGPPIEAMSPSEPMSHADALAEVERLNLELYSALAQLEELRGIGEELARCRAGKSTAAGPRRMRRLLRR